MNTMKRCLRCGNICKETAIFCEDCQLALLKRSKQKLFQTEPMFCPQTKTLSATKMIREDDDIDSTALGRRPMPWVRRRAALRRTRRIFIMFALLVIIALLVDGLLVALVLTHSSHSMHHGNAFPLLTSGWNCDFSPQAVSVTLNVLS